MLVSLGTKLGLLPGDRALTITDRKQNAALAIAGVLLLGLSILFDLWYKYLSCDPWPFGKPKDSSRINHTGR
jgi:hypothetical protein